MEIKEAIEYLNISGARFQLKKFDFLGFSTFAQGDVLASERNLKSEMSEDEWHRRSRRRGGTNLLLLQGNLLLFKLADAIVQLREPGAGEHNDIGKVRRQLPVHQTLHLQTHEFMCLEGFDRAKMRPVT
jgi:hypothetical protein